jgi:nitroreductase
LEDEALEYTDLVRKRRSIRRYKSDPVPEQHLKSILEAARLAPSWGNHQCWRYIIVTEQDIKQRLAEAGEEWVSEAPVIIVVCADPKASGHKPGMDYFMLDVGISFEHLILAATNLGLGTCWIGGFDEKIAREALGVPDGIRVVAYTAIGYPDIKKGEVFARKPLRDICFYERYGQAKSQGLQYKVIGKMGQLYKKGRRLSEKLRNQLVS